MLDKPSKTKKFLKELSPDIRQYSEFCLTFNVKQLISCPTTTTCHTSTLVHHILTNTEECISQSGAIVTAISNHTMIYCARKNAKAKCNKHKEISFRSLKY